MRRRHGNRARLGVLLAALGALAILALPSVAAAKDRNHDQIPDRWEKAHSLSLSVKQGARDQDRDHLDNRGEFKAGDNPRNRDSDNDGVLDGDENAGTIASYDSTTGKLTITLFGGDTISGFVTEETLIRCGMECHNMGDESGSQASASRHGEDESGDDSGSDNSGPGNGEEVSDDPPNHDENDNDGGQVGDDPPNHDANDDHGHDGRGPHGDNGFNCTPDALVVGATVDEAELELRDGKATFEKIELERSSSSTE
jgi:hypothetical protein